MQSKKASSFLIQLVPLDQTFLQVTQIMSWWLLLLLLSKSVLLEIFETPSLCSFQIKPELPSRPLRYPAKSQNCPRATFLPPLTLLSMDLRC